MRKRNSFPDLLWQGVTIASILTLAIPLTAQPHHAGKKPSSKSIHPPKTEKFDLLSLHSVKRQLHLLQTTGKKRPHTTPEKVREHDTDTTATSKVLRSGFQREENEYAGEAAGARLYYLQPRVFPGDRLNTGVFRRASQLRDRLPAAKIPGRNVKNIQAPGGFANWQPVGPPGIGRGGGAGRINGVAYDPSNPSTLYAASASGGAWRSDDGGGSWIPLTDFQQDLGSSSVAVDPFDSNTVYVGTGDYDHGDAGAFGVLKSTDGGQTWAIKGANVFGGNPIHRITIDPNTPSKLFACAGGAGLFLSTDGGETWQMVIGPTATAGAPAVSGSFSNLVYNWTGTVIYASADNAGIYISTDGGLTWTSMPGAPSGAGRFDVAASPVQTARGERTLYVLSGGTPGDSEGTVSMGTPPAMDIHGAIVFTTLPFPKAKDLGFNPWRQKWYDFYIGCTHQILTYSDNTTKDVDVVYVGLVDLWQSPDAGQLWQTVGGIHTDHHAYTVNPNDASQIWVGEDGGFFNVGYTQTAIEPVKMPTPPPPPPYGNFAVTPLNNQLATVQFYFGAYHPTDTTNFLGGTQDNGTLSSFFDPTNWGGVPPGGDGGTCGIDLDQPNIQYASVYGGRVFDIYGLPIYGFARTQDAWSSAGDMSLYVGDDVEPFLLVGKVSTVDPSQYFVGTNYLYKHTEGASTNWTKFRQRFSNTGFILAVTNAPTDPNYLYVGTLDGTLWFSKDAGTTFTRIDRQGLSGGLPYRSVTGIAVSPLNPRKLFATVSGNGSSHIWRCDDATHPTWVSIGGEAGNAPFPDIYTNCVCVLPRNGDKELFVGTDIGVFYTSDGGMNWTNATAPLQLPNVDVRDLTYMPGTAYLMATTFGRGMWRLPLPIQVAIGSLLVTPNPIVGGSVASATVTIDGIAPSGGVHIALVSANPAAATMPTHVTVPAGQSHVDFTVTTRYVAKDTPVKLTASANGRATSTTLLVQHPVLATLTLTPANVPGGGNAVGAVTLTGPTPSGVTIQLTSTNAALVGLPATITVPANRVFARFLITTRIVSQDTAVSIHATANGITLSSPLLVQSPKLASLSLAPTTVQSGGISIATVRLTGAALRGGAYVILNTNSGNVVIPARVIIPQGQTAVQFRVHTTAVTATTTATLTANYNGTTASGNLTITP